MPFQALSLFACLPETQAVGYLLNQCGFSRPVCSQKLALARAKYGKSILRAGHPIFQDIPPEFQTYLERVKMNPRFGLTTDNGKMAYSFQLVEIEPLLAYQYYVSLEEVSQIGLTLGDASNIEMLLHLCLPFDVKDISAIPSGQKGKVVLTSSDLNTRLYDRFAQIVPEPQQKLGAFVGLFALISSPLVQVVRFEGRSYLKNGYHRACAIRKSGTAFMPCILLEANSEADIGYTEPGFLPVNVLKSNNPPTVGHFTNDRAFPLVLKRLKRQITISWSEALVDGE